MAAWAAWPNSHCRHLSTPIIVQQRLPVATWQVRVNETRLAPEVSQVLQRGPAQGLENTLAH